MPETYTDVDAKLSPEQKLRLSIAALYAQPGRNVVARLWNTVMIKVGAYICNYANRPLDPHHVARGLEAELRALQDRRKGGGAQDLAGNEFVEKRG